MARLVLSRSLPITLAEAAALPVGARVDNGAHGGRVELDVPGRDLEALLAAAVALGRAVPDGLLVPHDLPDLSAPPPRPKAAAASPEPAPSQPLPATPWQHLDEGRLDQALGAFAHEGLDPEGRDRVRALGQSTDPEEVALACRIATAAQWRSFVTHIRRMLDHGDTRVRLEAVRAIGSLSGPALSLELEQRAHDPSPEVRQAIKDALASIEARRR